MDQCLQVGKIVDEKIGGSILECNCRVPIGYTASSDACVPACKHIDSRVSDHPGPFALTSRVGQNLIDTNRVRFLMVKAVTTVNGREVLINPKTIQHGTTEMNRFIRQYRKLAIRQSVQSFANARVKRRTVEHMRAVIAQKHLQPCLNVCFNGLSSKRSSDQHQSTVADETSDLFLRQNRQIELMTDMIDRGREILFRINQRTVQIENQYRAHGQIIALAPRRISWRD